MSPTPQAAAPAPPAPLTPAEAAAIRAEMDELFWVDSPGELPAIVARLQSLGAEPAADTPVAAARRAGLESLWHFFEGERVLQTKADYAGAVGHMREAEAGFERVGHGDLLGLAHATGEALAAQINLQNLSIEEARQGLERARDYLKRAGQFSDRFQALIDHLEPQSWAAAGLQALTRQEYAKAQACVSEAARAWESVARTYYKEDQYPYHRFLGQAELFRAFYAFQDCYRQFTLFDYRGLLRRDPAPYAAAARGHLARAVEILAKSGQTDRETEALKTLTDLLPALSGVVLQMARAMAGALDATIKPDRAALDDSRKQITTAQELAARAGPAAELLSRTCDSLAQQANNIDRLTAPKKKDFGIFSGLVSCAAAVVIFLVFTVVSRATGTKADSAQLLGSAVGLGLIAGFGYGALRFKSLFPWGAAAGKGEK